MSKWNRKQLVLDASVAFGSSDRMFNPVGDVAGDQNRKCLEAVRDEEHVAVFNRQLQQEWRTHMSPFARQWLQFMTRKGRTLIEEGDSYSRLKEPACLCQGAAEQRTALEKDFHLIQSALATGQLILSNETKFPRYVANACQMVPDFLQLYYGGPVVEGEVCRLWIKGGAEKEGQRRIDVWAHYH
jgi:hypothetical protein